MRFAIARKRLLQCTYDTRLRIAEPHDYGLLHGVAKLLVYQIRWSRSQAHQRHYQWNTLFARVE